MDNPSEPTSSEFALDAGAPLPAAEPVHQRPDVWCYLRFLTVAIGGLAIDLWSKEWAFHTLKQASKPMVILPNLLEFQTMLNKGALFGIGAGQTPLFLGASVIALFLVFWMLRQTPRNRWALQIALGGILAGALGNMYDRVFVRLDENPRPVPGRGWVFMQYIQETERGHYYEEYPIATGGIKETTNDTPKLVGCVRDFIKIPTKWQWFGRQGDLWPWVFNVADMLLVGGVGILAIHLWRDRKSPPAGPLPGHA